MKPVVRVVLWVGLVLVALTGCGLSYAFGVFVGMRTSHAANKEFIGEVIQVVVARDRIEAGERLSEHRLAPRAVPARFLRGSGAHLEWSRRLELVGAWARGPIDPGEFVAPHRVETAVMEVVAAAGIIRAGEPIRAEQLQVRRVSAAGMDGAPAVAWGNRDALLGKQLTADHMPGAWINPALVAD